MAKVGDQEQLLKEELSQWFFNISKFSQDLLDGLDELNTWPNKVKTMQKNWIGKSFGCEIDFDIEGDLPINRLSVLQQDQILFLDFLFSNIIDHEISIFIKTTKSL